MTATSTIATVPGYISGTWVIDPVHSDVGFTVRHMMVSKVRGRFARFEGQIVTGENPVDSTVTASIDLTSIDTNNAQRDEHIRSADFFEVETYPTMTYTPTSKKSALRMCSSRCALLVSIEVRSMLAVTVESTGFSPVTI